MNINSLESCEGGEGMSLPERKNTCTVPLMILYRPSLIYKRLEDFLHYKFESAGMHPENDAAERVQKEETAKTFL